MAVLVSDKFYTYTWLRKDGTPYYIGKGTKNRATVSCEGHRPPCVDNIIIQEHQSETDAFEAEKFLIAHYGRKDLGTGILRNLTDGGDGVPGYVFTEEDRKKLGSGLRGKKRPPRSEDWKRKLGESVRNYWATPEGQEALQAGIIKRSANLVWREKLILTGRRNSVNPIWRKNISNGVKQALGRPEIKAKMAAVMAERSENGWAEKMAVRSANPEWLEKQKEGSKRRSENPQWHENCRKGQKLRRDRERFERYLLQTPPEFLQVQ